MKFFPELSILSRHRTLLSSLKILFIIPLLKEPSSGQSPTQLYFIYYIACISALFPEYCVPHLFLCLHFVEHLCSRRDKSKVLAITELRQIHQDMSEWVLQEVRGEGWAAGDSRFQGYRYNGCVLLLELRWACEGSFVVITNEIM